MKTARLQGYDVICNISNELFSWTPSDTLEQAPHYINKRR